MKKNHEENKNKIAVVVVVCMWWGSSVAAFERSVSGGCVCVCASVVMEIGEIVNLFELIVVVFMV